jgi:hypothetical protein
MIKSTEQQLASAVEAAWSDIEILQQTEAQLSDRLARLAAQLDADKEALTARLEQLAVRITEAMAHDAAHLAAQQVEAETQIAALSAQNAAIIAERDGLAAQLQEAKTVCSRLAETEAARIALAEEFAAVSAERTALSDRIAADEKAYRTKEAAWAQQAKEREAAHASREAAFLAEMQTLLANNRSSLAAIEAERDQLAERLSKAERNAITPTECEICHRLAPKTVFVMGFARSSTTITLQILNSAHNAQLLGEANFFMPNPASRFRDWYNDQHISFGNQITKSSFAADFLPDVPHRWYEWLNRAASYYDVVGEKIAFSAYHFSLVQPSDVRSFYEARFFDARYIFLIRNPIDTLLSAARLFGITDDSEMRKHCLAWLAYVQLWADWIRVFPRNMTVVADEFDEAAVDRLALFTGLDLKGAKSLIEPEKKYYHDSLGAFPSLQRIKVELMMIFEHAIAAVHGDPVLWQAEQKRDAVSGGPMEESAPITANIPRTLGIAWSQAEALRGRLLREGAQ